MTIDLRAALQKAVDALTAIDAAAFSEATDFDSMSKMSDLAEDALAEACAALAQPEPEGPTDDQIDAMERAHWEPTGVVSEAMQYEQIFNYRTFLRAGLARWGHPTPQPILVSERLPEAGDCTTNPRTGQGQWCWGWVQTDKPLYSGRWRMMRREWLADEAVAWLPAHALPLPQDPEPPQ